MAHEGRYEIHNIIARSRRRRRVASHGASDNRWLNVMLAVFGLMAAGLLAVIVVAVWS